MSEPPRWTIRRTVAILTASLLLVVVLGVPAWAGATIAPAEVTADVDVTLTLTVTEPEDEAYGDTAHVAVIAPTGFAILGCGEATLGWSCAVAEDGTRVTFTRTSPVALATTRDLRFSVHTPAVNGTYAFQVTQADGPANQHDPPAAVSSRPPVTVTGGTDPAPQPTSTPTPATGGTQTGGTQANAGGGPPTTDPTPAVSAPAADTGAETSSSGAGTRGSTAPTRTQGRASGSTLEIIPGQPSDDDPVVVAPDVADDPAVAPVGDGAASGEDDDAAVAATGTGPSDDRGGPPWQQLAGAAMLLIGGAVVAIRRWDLTGRLRGLEPAALFRRWQRD